MHSKKPVLRTVKGLKVSSLNLDEYSGLQDESRGLVQNAVEFFRNTRGDSDYYH